jgi:hypothetical protein
MLSISSAHAADTIAGSRAQTKRKSGSFDGVLVMVIVLL